jgi:hypothetical protein
MTAIAQLLNPRDRDKLLARMRELSQLDTLVRERSLTRPPDPPPPLAAIAAEPPTRTE